MGALAIFGGTSAFFATGIYLFRRRISKNWLTAASITHPVDLTKKRVLITGGNTGLGYQAALDLASRGAHIVLGCRDIRSAESAANKIRAATNNDDVSCMQLDLSSLTSVREFANNVKMRYDSVYALICNAGVWVPMNQKCKTVDGYEIHFGVNHLGHFLLIQELLPLLKSSGMDSRIVMVSSGLSKSGKIDMVTKEFVKEGRPQSENGFAPSGYCDSKLMNALTVHRLAKELEGSNVAAYSVCPGFCKSDLGRYVEMPSYKRVIGGSMMRLFQRSSVQGAQNIVFATVQDKSELVNGGFYQDGKVNEEVMASHKEVEKPLWDLSMDLIKEK
eukprot:scaffold56180_cov77-Cyclotella_meneghiniana.AAC.2